VIGTLIARDLGVFIRSRASVIFALSPVVLCVGFLVFFRQQTITLISDVITGPSAYAATDAWIFASVAVLSGFSSSTSVLIGFLEDRRSSRFSLQLASSVKPGQLVAGYLLSSVIVSIVVSLVISGFGQVYALLVRQPVMSINEWLTVIVAVVLSSVMFTGVTAIAMRFVGSQGALGAYCLIMGTVVGIVSFSYVLPSSDVTVIAGCLPFLQAATLVRHPMLTPVLNGLDAGSATQVLEALGASVHLGAVWSQPLTIAVLALWSVIVLVVGSLLLTQCLKD